MTQDEIIAMAKEAGLPMGLAFAEDGLVDCVTIEVKRFAALVVAKEREACAQVCEENQEESLDIARGALVTEQGEAIHQAMAFGAANCLSAIRERGNT